MRFMSPAKTPSLIDVRHLLWGGIGGMIAAFVSIACATFHVSIPDNFTVTDPSRAAFVGFFMGYGASMLRNWVERKH
jgi:hypothetical protein